MTENEGVTADPIVAFLRARIAEDEAAARAVTVPHEWHTGPGDDPEWTDEELVCMWPPEFHTPYEEDKHWRGLTVPGLALAAHIARHDPAAALRRIAADRRMLELHVLGETNWGDGFTSERCMVCDPEPDESAPAFPCATLRLLAEGYGWTVETA